jgi:hypothetical protein
MRKIAVTSLAVVCLVAGLLTVWTPLPTGVPLIALGLFLLLTVSPRAKRVLRGVRANHHRVDRGLEWIEARAHRSMAVTLRRTRPYRHKAKLALLQTGGIGERPPA